MGWLITALGAGLVLLALRDVFHTLWHPYGWGSLSSTVVKGLWLLSHRIDSRRRFASLIGPLAMVVVVLMWTVLVVVGWALIYWPHMPGALSFSPGLWPEQRSHLLDSLYFSLVTLATLGFGDIVPTDGWLRIAVPLQALVGFALLTAFVSWVSQIYPALNRRRALALRLASLRRATRSAGRQGPGVAAAQLTELAAQILEARVDFKQQSITYYFHDDEDGSSLAAMIGYAAELALTGQRSPDRDLRFGAAMLADALQDLAAVLDEDFLHRQAPPLEVFAAYAADHGQQHTRS
ncbi:potassium channel family protein [Streptomyces sparsus]